MSGLIYNFVIAPLLAAGYRVLSFFQPKAREFFRIREGLRPRLAAEKERVGRPEAAWVLVHVASVGELLQAVPVIAGLKKQGIAVALSYTSPSVANHMPKGVPADIIIPSPLDTKSQVKKFLSALSPKLLIFSTYDLWPGMVMGAAERGIPMILVNASLPADSGRIKFPARIFFRSLYARLQAVGAITEADAARFPALGVPATRVAVTGNCRYDQTLARCRAVADDDPDLARLPAAELRLVAGSTWPQDQKHLLPALSQLLIKYPKLAAVIAPHEPTEKRLGELEDFFRAAGIAPVRYSMLREKGPAEARVVLVDGVGKLYKLYKRGDMAYVGGSFQQGVHNVMEPAGMGLPVIVGPVHNNSAEALEMVEVGGAKVAGRAEEIEKVMTSWIEDEALRKQAGVQAKKVVEQNAGAADRTLALVEKYLPPRSGEAG